MSIMALNLKKDNCDRIVPNCSSDESGSDCSSEELIDCDVIVDVTTVTAQNDEDKAKLQRLNGKHINENVINEKSSLKTNDTIENSKKTHEDLNIKNEVSTIEKIQKEVSDKTFSAINRNLDLKQNKPNAPNHKKRRVNFNLTIDIAKPPLSRDRDSGEQCVPQCPQTFGGPGSVDFADIESLSEPIPTTPGGKPQVNSLHK